MPLSSNRSAAAIVLRENAAEARCLVFLAHAPVLAIVLQLRSWPVAVIGIGALTWSVLAGLRKLPSGQRRLLWFASGSAELVDHRSRRACRVVAGRILWRRWLVLELDVVAGRTHVVIPRPGQGEAFREACRRLPALGDADRSDELDDGPVAGLLARLRHRRRGSVL